MRWDKWAGGLINSIVGGVGTAASGYLATVVTGQIPEWRVMGTMILVASLWNFSSYIKSHPLPIGDDDVSPASLKDLKD